MNGAHWVRAEKPFKMALLLTLIDKQKEDQDEGVC